MIKIKGKYNTAVVYTQDAEDSAVEQIELLCDQPFTENSKICIMPDVHAGVGCTIGTTMTISNKIVPNLVGVDIGCGMETVMLKNKTIDLGELDKTIYDFVPSGREIHEGRKVKFDELQQMNCYRALKDTKKTVRSIGTLGGGNHFIEANKDDSGNIYIVVHSGSRSLGKEVAEYYQNLAYELSLGKGELFNLCDALIADYKAQGRRADIESALATLKKDFKQKQTEIPKELAYLDGKYFDMYLADMKICQEFAELNRRTIISTICEKCGYEIAEQFTTTHNYIDTQNMILRKGAVSAKKGEKLLIPINMKDGSLVCTGKGNSAWNFSAPHGAGRLMSRNVAKEKLNLDDYQNLMKNIYTTSVNEKTLDECPLAYKPIEQILANIKDTVSVDKIIKPIYNFKSST